MDGKYVLGDVLGTGGMGMVYLASQPDLQRTVAVKILRPELVDDPRMLRHFHREAMAAARVTHPSLVAMFDVGKTEDGRPFLVMEYVAGRLLGDLVRERPVPLHRSREIVTQILAALAEVHRAGIVHADVKADNVMVESTRHGDDRVRVVDFGLARITAAPDQAPAEIPLDEDLAIGSDGRRYVSGTPEYMAPEVIGGDAPTAASDLYGVGVILYELLTGTTPFGGGSVVDIITRHLTDPVVPPSLLRPDRYLPPALDEVVARALEKSPADRFPDAEAFAAALQRAVPNASLAMACRGCGAHLLERGAPCPVCAEASAAAAMDRPLSDRAAAREQPTMVWRAARPRRAARASTSPPGHDREDRLRRAIADAIAAGGLHDVADGYLGLAALLVARGEDEAAVHELEEGLDVVAAGEDPRTARPGSAAYRLRKALTELHPPWRRRRSLHPASTLR